MGIVIDSSIFIAAERGHLDLAAVLHGHAGEQFVLASITASEMLNGVERAVTDARRIARSATVEHVLASYPVVDFDLPIARVHAKVAAALAAGGVSVGAHDLLIAATALSLGYRVATRDVRSFPRIASLQTLLW